MKKKTTSQDPMKAIQKIFKERGTKALKMARSEILREKIECKEAKEALTYFMTEYWHDLARPSLLSLVCEAVGGDPELTTPIAVSMTLISGGIDIHDDIIDQSTRKYGRPTVYGKYGKELALLVGDALLFKGLTRLNQATENGVPTGKMGIIVDTIKNMFFELGDAEASELQFRGNLDISPEEYLRVVRKKAADVEAHTRVGAILGNASPKQIEALGEYGRLLGMLIVLGDDWMDVFDVEEIYGRVKKESLPLPVLYALLNPVVEDKLRSTLLQKTAIRKNAESILETIQETDVPQKYAKLMNELAEEAVQILRKHKINRKDLELLLKTTISL